MIDYGYLYIDYQLVKYKVVYSKKVKSVYCRIDKNLNIEVTSPFGVSLKFLNSIIENNYASLMQIKEAQKKILNFNLNNDALTILGERLKIIVKTAKQNEKFKLINDCLYLFLKKTANKEKVIRRFLIKQANVYIRPWCLQLADKYRFDVGEISIKWLTRVWGSCRKNAKHLTFSAKLITLKKELIEYVIVHELAHLIEANHSINFWNVVAKFDPDYKRHVKELKKFR